ncbi:hypothetical protein T484DRAFT_1867059 [Baffinella frigidus]|nr:hypothetical protein T484DRAFT_1867059 [Cryptophyta sp. CCMP2293]
MVPDRHDLVYVLKLWDIGNRREWKNKKLEAAGRSLAFSPDGKLWDIGNRRESKDKKLEAAGRSLAFSPDGKWKNKKLEAAGRSLAFSPDGKVVAVGHHLGSFSVHRLDNMDEHLGSFSVHRLDNMDEVISARDRKKAIFSVTFAPNGRYLAVGYAPIAG